MALVSFPLEDTTPTNALPAADAANHLNSNGATNGDSGDDDSNPSSSSISNEWVPKTASAALRALSKQAARASLGEPWLRAVGQLKLSGYLKAAVEAVAAGAIAAIPVVHGTVAVGKSKSAPLNGDSDSLEEHLPLVEPATSLKWVDSLEALHEVTTALNTLLDNTGDITDERGDLNEGTNVYSESCREVWAAVDTEWGHFADSDPRGDFAPPCVLQIALAEAPPTDASANTLKRHKNSGGSDGNGSDGGHSSSNSLGTVQCFVLDVTTLMKDADAAPLLATLVQTILGTQVRSSERKNQTDETEEVQVGEAEGQGVQRQQRRRRRLRLLGFAFDHDVKRLATVAGWTVPPSWIGSKRRPGTKNNSMPATSVIGEPKSLVVSNPSSGLTLQVPISPQSQSLASAFQFTDLQEAVRATKMWRRGPNNGGPPSLRRACTCLLQQRLDKDGLQCSDWDARPLSQAQLAYAALDAEVLLRLASVLSAAI